MDLFPNGVLICVLVLFLLRRIFRIGELIKPMCFTLGMKAPNNNTYCHFRLIPYILLKSTGLPLTAFIMQAFSGISVMFPKAQFIHFHLASEDYFLLVKPDAVEEFLRNHTNAISRKSWVYDMLHPWLGTGLLTSYGSKWKSRRRLLTPSFNTGTLANLLPAFDEKSKILVEILKFKQHEEWVDIRQPIALCALDIVCETLLGVDVGAQTGTNTEFVQAIHRNTQLMMERVTNPMFHSELLYRLSSSGREFRQCTKRIHQFVRQVISLKKAALNQQEGKNATHVDHKNTKTKSLLDLLLHIHLSNREFTEDAVLEEINTFVFAGLDTTSTGIIWALFLIGLYPDIQNRIYDELEGIFGDDRQRSIVMDDLRKMQYMERVLKESQRLYPSVPMIARTVQEDICICGYTVKKGSTVVISNHILHKNPEVFDEPEKFDPDRFCPENSLERSPFAYVPFSAGSRNCIGMHN